MKAYNRETVTRRVMSLNNILQSPVQSFQMSSQSVTGLVGFSARIATHTFVALLVHPLSPLLHHPTHRSHMSILTVCTFGCLYYILYNIQYVLVHIK
jgi:hypothetical protein